MLVAVGGITFGAVTFGQALGFQDSVGLVTNAVGPATKVGLEGNLTTSIATAVKIALALVGTIFLGLTVYAGILWMTASGAEDKIEKAQGIIKATVIGLGITFGAYAITAFVGSKLGGSGAPTPSQVISCTEAPNNGNCVTDNGAPCPGGTKEIQGTDCAPGKLCCAPL